MPQFASAVRVPPQMKPESRYSVRVQVWPERELGRTDDRWRVAEEAVQRRGRRDRRAGRRVHAHDVVHDLEDTRVAVAVVADAQPLVGRLEAELIGPGRRAEPLLEVVEAGEAGEDPWVRGPGQRQSG